MMELGHLNLPKIAFDKNADDKQYIADKLHWQYYGFISNDSNGKKILEELEKDPRVQSLEECLISSGNGASLFHVKTLAMWYTWAINELGYERAEKNLNSFLDSKMVPVINTLWIWGVELERSLTLDNGVKIVPIDEMPDSKEKENYLTREFISFDPHEHKPKAAIIFRSEVLKVRTLYSSDKQVKDNLFVESYQFLDDVSLLLNLIQGISCTPFLSTTYTLPEMPFGMFDSSSFSCFRHDVLGNQPSKLSEESILEINSLLASFNKLKPKHKKRMSRILSRFSQAKRREQIEDKILDLGIALEMALLTDNKNNDQLSLTFRLRGTWLLGENYADRKSIFNQLKDIYNYRSQVAHTGMLRENDNVEKINKIRDEFREYSNLAENIIKQLIYKGDPDWSEIILGGI